MLKLKVFDDDYKGFKPFTVVIKVDNEYDALELYKAMATVSTRGKVGEDKYPFEHIADILRDRGINFKN